MTNKSTDDLSKTVLQKITHLIFDKALQPGEAISQRIIAMRLGVSTQPVAIAFKQLEADGLIVSRNRCGTFVALLSPQESWDAMQLRLAVEERAVKLVCANASDEAIESLRTLAEAADCLDNAAAMLEADNNFHLALCEMTGSPALSGFLKQKMPIFRAKSFLCPALNQLAASLLPHGALGSHSTKLGHLALFDAIRQRDAGKAGELMETHICVKGVSALLEQFSNSTAQ